MRYELKYAIENVTAEQVVSRIMMHPASFRVAYPDRQVNNIYLDAPNFQCFYQNIEGQPRRNKMRLRWYGESLQPTPNSVLEIKQKDRELGWKDSYPIEQTEIKNANQLLGAIAEKGIHQGLLSPTLHNTYERSYFLSHDGKFRMTVDRNQAFTIPFSPARPLSIDIFPVIVELKFEKEDFDRSSAITDYIPFRQTKNSKYTTGIEYLYF